MKKYLFTLLLVIGFTSFSFSQGKGQIKRANDITGHIAKQLDLSDEDREKVNAIYLAQIVSNSNQIKGKDLTQNQKQQIYKSGNLERTAALVEAFGNEKGNAIAKAGFAAMKAIRKK